eukprot:g45834.t1
MNWEIHSLLKIRRAAFMSDDSDRKSRYDLRKDITNIKRQYWTKLERTVFLTSIIMKYFEKLVMSHINSSLPACLDPLQFVYRRNRSRADTISLAPHSSLEHLDGKVIYRPQGCSLSPLLDSLYIHDSVAKFRMIAIYKFAANITVNRKKLQTVMCAAQTITEASLPSMESTFACCHGKAANIIKDSSHPGNALLQPLPVIQGNKCLQPKQHQLRVSGLETNCWHCDESDGGQIWEVRMMLIAGEFDDGNAIDVKAVKRYELSGPGELKLGITEQLV